MSKRSRPDTDDWETATTTPAFPTAKSGRNDRDLPYNLNNNKNNNRSIHHHHQHKNIHTTGSTNANAIPARMGVTNHHAAVTASTTTAASGATNQTNHSTTTDRQPYHSYHYHQQQQQQKIPPQTAAGLDLSHHDLRSQRYPITATTTTLKATQLSTKTAAAPPADTTARQPIHARERPHKNTDRTDEVETAGDSSEDEDYYHRHRRHHRQNDQNGDVENECNNHDPHGQTRTNNNSSSSSNINNNNNNNNNMDQELIERFYRTVQSQLQDDGKPLANPCPLSMEVFQSVRYDMEQIIPILQATAVHAISELQQDNQIRKYYQGRNRKSRRSNTTMTPIATTTTNNNNSNNTELTRKDTDHDHDHDDKDDDHLQQDQKPRLESMATTTTTTTTKGATHKPPMMGYQEQQQQQHRDEARQEENATFVTKLQCWELPGNVFPPSAISNRAAMGANMATTITTAPSVSYNNDRERQVCLVRLAQETALIRETARRIRNQARLLCQRRMQSNPTSTTHHHSY